MNKKITVILAALILSSCTLTFNSSGDLASSSETSQAEELRAPELNEEYGRQTSLAISLLSDSLSQSGPMMRNRMTEDEELAAVAKVKRYLGIMEQLISNNPISTEMLESDREGYDFKIIITTKMLDGTTNEFVMYFNALIPEDETSSSEENSPSEVTTSEDTTTSNVVSTSIEEETTSDSTTTEATSASDEDEFDEIDDDYESEDIGEVDEEDKNEYENYRDSKIGESNDEGEVTTISGIAIIGDVEYNLVGGTKVEGNETKTSYFISLNSNNWIRISTETEEGETKYMILKKTGGFVNKMFIKTELEDGGAKVKIFIQPEAGQPVIYSFFKAVDAETGEQYIRISARDGDGRFMVRVFITTNDLGETVYKFRFDGSQRDHEENRDHDYGDEHEEDED